MSGVTKTPPRQATLFFGHHFKQYLTVNGKRVCNLVASSIVSMFVLIICAVCCFFWRARSRSVRSPVATVCRRRESALSVLQRDVQEVHGSRRAREMVPTRTSRRLRCSRRRRGRRRRRSRRHVDVRDVRRRGWRCQQRRARNARKGMCGAEGGGFGARRGVCAVARRPSRAIAPLDVRSRSRRAPTMLFCTRLLAISARM
jgi:hypothetical protein